MADEEVLRTPTADPDVELILHKPFMRPGTPEAHRAGCLCSFEGNMSGAMRAAERGDGSMFVAINEACPLHEMRPIDRTPET